MYGYLYGITQFNKLHVLRYLAPDSTRFKAVDTFKDAIKYVLLEIPDQAYNVSFVPHFKMPNNYPIKTNNDCLFG